MRVCRSASDQNSREKTIIMTTDKTYCLDRDELSVPCPVLADRQWDLSDHSRGLDGDLWLGSNGENNSLMADENHDMEIARGGNLLVSY